MLKNTRPMISGRSSERILSLLLLSLLIALLSTGCVGPGRDLGPAKSSEEAALRDGSEPEEKSKEKVFPDGKDSDRSREKELFSRKNGSPEDPGTDLSGRVTSGPSDTGDEKKKTWKTPDSIFNVSPGFYQKLNKGEDVNILINGDSIGAGSGASKGNSWTDLIKSYVESEYQVSCNVANISLGGNGSYAGYVLLNALDDGTDYDLMVVCYGQNDEEAPFFTEYEALIRSALKKYPSLNIISVLESSQREYTEKMREIEEIAEYYDIRTADTIAAFDESGKEYGDLTVDALHPNDEGYKLYFEAVKEVIETEVANDTGVEDITRIPLSNEVSGYENCSYYPVSRFVRKSDTTFELSLDNGFSGIIGLYHLFCPPNGDLVISIDGKEVIRKPMNWTNPFNQYFIYKPDTNVHTASGRVEITFPSREMADSFKGMAVSET